MSGSTFVSARGFGKSAMSSGDFWVSQRVLDESIDTDKENYLYKVVASFIEELEEPLKIAYYSAKYSGRNVNDASHYLKVIRTRLHAELYDSSENDIDYMMDHIVLHEWPSDWNKPEEGTLSISTLETTFIVLFKKFFKLTSEQRIKRAKKLRDIENDKRSKDNIKHLSRIHSRRK